MIFAHRLTLLDDKKCDICGSTVLELTTHYIDRNLLYGWKTCSKESCLETVLKYKEETTIPFHSIIERHRGEKVYIKRTNGKIESGWKIYGPAFKTNSQDVYWINVKHLTKHITKCVSLYELDIWNKL